LTKKIKKKSKQRFKYKIRNEEEAVSAGADKFELEAIKKSLGCKHGNKLKSVIDYIAMFNIEDPETSRKCWELC